MTFETKEAALDALEQARKDYITEARTVAYMIFLGKGSVTVDDVREVCPPPAGVDPRVMGAIFHTADWVKVGFRNSKRKTCHKRPIAVFELV